MVRGVIGGNKIVDLVRPIALNLTNALFGCRDSSSSRQYTLLGVSLLFFLYGAKLSTATIAKGLTNWSLQSLCLLCTFLLFPALTFAISPLTASLLPAAVSVGFLYIGCLPSEL